MSAVSSRANTARNAFHCAAMSSSLSLRESGTSILLAEATEAEAEAEAAALGPDDDEDAAALRAALPIKRRARTEDTAALVLVLESDAMPDGDESLELLALLLVMLLAPNSSLKRATHCISAALPIAAVDARSAQSRRTPPSERSSVSRSPSQSQRCCPALRKVDEAAADLALPILRASSPSSCENRCLCTWY